MPSYIPGINSAGQLAPGLAASTVRTTLDVLSSSAIAAAFAPISHTHSISDVTGFGEAVDDRVSSLLVAGTNVTLSYNDVANTLTINASGGSGISQARAMSLFIANHLIAI